MNDIIAPDRVAEANQAYGALTEGLYIAGFTFERAMGHALGLLKDDGWCLCGAGFDDVNEFVRSLRLDQFKVVADQRKAFVERVKALQPKVSNRAIADALGVAHTTISRGGANAPDAARNVQQNGKAAGANAPLGLSGAQAARLIGRKEDVAAERQWKDDQAKAAFHKVKAAIPSNLHVGDFREKAQIIPDGSVDLIFTDPPYDRDSVPLYEAAAKEAARILKPGGSLISYCGQVILRDVLWIMGAHIDYFWEGAHVHDGGPMTQMRHHGILVGLKPLLWFVKGGKRGDPQALICDTVLVKREKAFHPWQQAVATAEHFIAGLTAETGMVVDFFAGGGTTLIAARNLKRSWHGFEIDEKAVAKIMERLAGAVTEGERR